MPSPPRPTQVPLPAWHIHATPHFPTCTRARTYAQVHIHACKAEFKKAGKSIEDIDDGVPSTWAVGEGQVAHDLMAYLNKLCRGSEESQDQDISQMKKACKKLGDSRKKKKNKEETQCEETQVEETQSNATQIETEDSQLEVELESQQHDEASQLFFEEAFLEESQLLLGDAAGAKPPNQNQGEG